MTKKSRKVQRDKVKSRSRRKRNVKADDSEPSVVCSRSYIIPGNSLTPRCIKGNDEKEDGFPEGCCITRADFRSIMGSRYNTPLPRIGADSKLGNRIGTPLDQSAEKNGPFLPDIKSFVPGRLVTRPEEPIIDLDMYDVECIRKTQSGIAFTQYWGRPYHLPRMFSDGQIEQRPAPRVNECASFVPLKLNRSGGTFADQVRTEVEESRRRRENRNLERVQRQLREMEGHGSRIGRSRDTNDERLRAVLEEQERLRRASFDKHVRKFMDKRH